MEAQDNDGSRISRRSKAAGAIRNIFNFLQKTRRKSDMSPASDGIVPSAEEIGLQNVSRFESSSKTINIEPRPLADCSNISETRSPRNQSSENCVVFIPDERGNPAEDDFDLEDDVFLEDSYFEDDYFEDFSCTSAKSDEETETDYTANVHPYSNNFDNCGPEKDYDKVLLDICSSKQLFTPRDYAKSGRRRRHSMPCDLPSASSDAASSCLYVRRNKSSREDIDKLELEWLRDLACLYKKPIPYFGFWNRDNLNTEENNYSFKQCNLDSETRKKIDIQKSAPASQSEIRNCTARIQIQKFAELASLHAAQMTENAKLEGRTASNSGNMLGSPSSRPNIKLFPKRIIYEGSRGLKAKRSLDESGVLNKPSFKSKTTTGWKTNAIYKRRLLTRASVESGYGSIDLLPSTPASPSSALDHSSPMGQLNIGALLSPYSRNTLDGITKQRTKRSLRKKSISPPSDLKPVPENTETGPMVETREYFGKSRDGSFDKDKVETKVEIVNMKPDTQIGERTNFGINLNLSLQLVDNNNVDINNNSIQSQNESTDFTGCRPLTLVGLKVEPAPSITPLRRPKDTTVFPSPLAKRTLQPMFTSSPLNSNQKVAQKSFFADTVTPLEKTSHGQIVRTVSPCSKTPSVIENGNAPKSTTERRKKLKRRSARARLLFDETDKCVDENKHRSISRDYVLLKNLAQSMINKIPNRETMLPWVDLPGLMESVNQEFVSIRKFLGLESELNLFNMKNDIRTIKYISTNLTLQNCVHIFLLAYLVQDWKRVRASMNFIFENLPAIIQQHSALCDLAPEIVMLLLSNPISIVNNCQGFPLPYASSELEVFKAVVKYVEAKERDGTDDVRIKNMLSTVADSRVLSPSYRSKSSRGIENYKSTGGGGNRKLPRRVHSLVFHRSSPFTNSDADYFLQPFISNSVKELDDLSPDNVNEAASPMQLFTACKEDYVLRKLYISYRRHNSVPHVTKIGMQYLCKGKKRTLFIAQSRKSDKVVSLLPQSDQCCQHDAGEVISDNLAHSNHQPTEVMVKKTAIVLEAGEHITGLSALTLTAIHNIEVRTNKGRRIRAHGLKDPELADWISIATPQGRSPYCLHAIYGDVQKTASRNYIRGLGAIWIAASSDAKTTS